MQNITFTIFQCKYLALSLNSLQTKDLATIKEVRTVGKLISILQEPTKKQEKAFEKLSEKQSEILAKGKKEYDERTKGKTKEEAKEVENEINTRIQTELEPIAEEHSKLDTESRKKTTKVEFTEDEAKLLKELFERKLKDNFLKMEDALAIADALGIE